jgi:hypothetical protein
MLLSGRWILLGLSGDNKEEELGMGPVFCFLFNDWQKQCKLLFIAWFFDDDVHSFGVAVI